LQEIQCKLWRSIGAGDEAAFMSYTTLCADRLPYLFGPRGWDRAIERRMCCKKRFWRGRQPRAFANVENPVAYLFQIARNEAKRLIARERLQPFVVIDFSEVFTATSNDAVESNRNWRWRRLTESLRTT